MAKKYDVVIMGGGPGGSTLAALLRRQTNLTVALVEKEKFPRDHIGESFSHRVIQPLAESGALNKVLASGCAIRKYGGIYAWDIDQPSVTLFDHKAHLEDGVMRWTFHVNRAEFDHVLLEHAKSLGVDVFESTSVESLSDGPDGPACLLDSGTILEAQIFVEASGRRRNLLASSAKDNLSKFKNMAIWTHVEGGLPAQSLAGDWNIFRKDDLSPIICAAFEDGWFWYIPINRVVNGKRTATHSLGVVTNPEVLKAKKVDYLDMKTLISQVKTVPLLAGLIDNIKPTYEKLNVATNYSMINENLANYDRRGLLVGDAAFFVDPLFSSGVAFTLNHAAAAACVVRSTLSGEYTSDQVRDLWSDYDESWRRMGYTYALSIDEWYHAIAQTRPNSEYWHRGSIHTTKKFREATFGALVDTSLTPDLLHVLTKGSGDRDDLSSDGPISQVELAIKQQEPAYDTAVRFSQGTEVTEGLTLNIPNLLPQTIREHSLETLQNYWADPEKHWQDAGQLYAKPEPCLKLRRQDSKDDAVTLANIEGTTTERLRAGAISYGELKQELKPLQRPLMRRLLERRMMEAF